MTKWSYYYEPDTNTFIKINCCIFKSRINYLKLIVLNKQKFNNLRTEKVNSKTEILILKTTKMAKNKDKKKGKNKNKGNDKPKGSADAQIVRTFSGSIALSKLEHVRMKKKGKKGKEIDCLVIPIKKNCLHVHESGVYMDLRINVKDQKDEYGQDGFIGQSIPGPVFKEMSDKEKEKTNLPILGNIIDWENSGGGSSKDNSGSAGEISEEDDLPF